jgi:hypothetical protein
MREHNTLWCEIYAYTVIPDGRGHCSWCGAFLHELTIIEASRLVAMFRDIGLKRKITQNWNASDWLRDDQAYILDTVRKTLLSPRR